MPCARSTAKTSLSRRYALGATVAGMALIFLLWRWHAWWQSPERMLERFRAAAQAGDVRTMLSLVDPDESQNLGIDAAVLGRLLRQTLPAPGAYRMSHATAEVFNDNQRLYNRGISYHLQDGQGRPLPTLGRACDLYIMAYRKDKESPWRIQLSGFLRCLGDYRYPGLYVTLLHDQGLPLTYLDQFGKSWQDLTLSPWYRPIVNSPNFTRSQNRAAPR